ncbi:hypothetical protein HID58_019025, partial [Brassica napus]
RVLQHVATNQLRKNHIWIRNGSFLIKRNAFHRLRLLKTPSQKHCPRERRIKNVESNQLLSNGIDEHDSHIRPGRCKVKETQNSTTMRRDLMFTAAAAAVFSLAKAAMADEEEPKRGTDAAKKKYAQVCVTMPTAKICRY